MISPLPPGLQFLRVAVGNSFENAGDVDVYHVRADAHDFLSVQFFGESFAQMGLFVRDTQGTNDISDDTFELLTAHERNVRSLSPVDRFDDGAFFQAVELTPMEAAPGSSADLLDSDGGLSATADGIQEFNLDYFIVVSPLGFAATDNHSYQLHITLASRDEMLDNVDGNGSAGLPVGEQIAYISNAPSANRNELGFNAPKQLVYLNFTGGLSTQVDPDGRGQPEDVKFDPFDAAVLDKDLAGSTNLLLKGGFLPDGQMVTGIIQNILTIFADTPGSHPLGTLNVQFIGNDLQAFTNALSGLFFTTTDPRNSGLEFTTLFVGPSDFQSVTTTGRLLGIAQGLDLANLDKGDDALVFLESFAGLSSGVSRADKLNAYARDIANTVAHELGHILGLPHTEAQNFSDLPHNDPGVEDDSNISDIFGNLIDRASLMSSGTNRLGFTDIGLRRLGTSRVERGEFPVGDLDQVDLLLKWLGSVI